MNKRKIAGIMGAAMFAGLPLNAEVVSSSDSTPVSIDTRKGVRYSSDTEVSYMVQWNSSWIGEDPSSEIVIADNGVEVQRVTGSGSFNWEINDDKLHVLTYTTYINGGAEDEVYSCSFGAVDCEQMGVPGLQRSTFTGSAYDASFATLGAAPIVTLDCEGMYDAGIPASTTYAYSGYMYFRAGETYTFHTCFDDFASVKVDGRLIIAKDEVACKEESGDVSFNDDGWRKVEFRVSNGSGIGGLVNAIGYQGIWYQTDKDTTWRRVEDDGSGTLLRTGADYYRGVTILRSEIRPDDPTVMDVVYKVESSQPTVKVRALAFKDGVRSLANVIRPETFIEGTDANIGDGITANEEHTLSWKVSADWQETLAKVKFEVLALDGELLPLQITILPKTDVQPKMEVSWNNISDIAVFDALLWLYADKDLGLTLTNGVLKNGDTRLADGASISKTMYDATVYLYGKMGYELLQGERLEYARQMLRRDLPNVSVHQYAVKIIEE